MSHVRLLIAVVAAALLIGLPQPQMARAADPLPTDRLVPGDYVRIVTNKGDLRAGPTGQHPAAYRMHKGEIAKVISEPVGCLPAPDPCNRGWYEVHFREGPSLDWTGFIRRPKLAYTGLAGERIGSKFERIVVVSLARQQAEAYENGELFLISPVTTGRRREPELITPTGKTPVTAKLSPYTFNSPWPEGHPFWYASITVDHAIRFRPGGYYLHPTPSRPRGGFGYGTDIPHVDPDGVTRDGSRGCINMPDWGALAMWDWITVGTPVKVVEH